MKLFSGLLVTLALSTSAFADATVSSADGEKFITWFSSLADTAVADQNDCVKMAGDINASVAANKDLIDKANAAMKAGQRLSQDQLQRVMQIAQKFAQAVVAKCAQDKNVQAAMQTIPRPGHK
jgi:hypothetical protein